MAVPFEFGNAKVFEESLEILVAVPAFAGTRFFQLVTRLQQVALETPKPLTPKCGLYHELWVEVASFFEIRSYEVFDDDRQFDAVNEEFGH